MSPAETTPSSLAAGTAAPQAEHVFEEIKRYIGFSDRDESCLRALGPRVAPHAARIIDDFYAHILDHDDASKVITGGDAQVARLKGTLLLWLEKLFVGPWDMTYYEQRARIGRRHVQINLPQQYMFTAVNVIRGHILEVVRQTAASPEALRCETDAVNRLLDMELAVMLHTYREDYMAQLQRGERLATFGQFVASIAHELRNPLGVIESSLFLVRRRLPDPGEGVVRHLDKIQLQVERSNRIITSLLDLVRDGPLRPRACTPSEILRQAVDSQHEHHIARLEVIADPATEQPVLWADPEHTLRIVVNLLDNALEAAGEEGSVQLRCVVDEASVRFRVCDSGPGVDPSVQSRLFEPLVTTKARGIGLGLALCRRLAARNGGSVQLTEGPLPGACFELVLPRATPRPEGAA